MPRYLSDLMTVSPCSPQIPDPPNPMHDTQIRIPIPGPRIPRSQSQPPQICINNLASEPSQFPDPSPRKPLTPGSRSPGSPGPNPRTPRSWFPSGSLGSQSPDTWIPLPIPILGSRSHECPDPCRIRLGSRISDPRSSYFRNSHPEGGRRQGA